MKRSGLATLSRQTARHRDTVRVFYGSRCDLIHTSPETP